MAERMLSEPFETVGEWFLPDAPDRKVSGSLSYDSTWANLHLNEAFQPLEGDIRLGSDHSYPVIYGFTRESEAITLFKALRTGISIKFGGAGMRQPERLVCSLAIVGAHIPADWVCPQMSFRIPGLEIWLSRPFVQQSYIHDEASGVHVSEYRVESIPVEDIWLESIQANVRFSVGITSSVNPFGSIDVSSSGWISFHPIEARGMDWYFEQFHRVLTLLSFFAGCPMSPDLVEVSLGIPHYKASVLMARQNAQVCPHKNLHEFLLSKGNLGVSLEEVLPRWLENCPVVWMPAQLAMSIFCSEALWLHVEFISLMQALEGFHRALFEGDYMPATEYADVVETLNHAIPATVSPDHRTSLASRIRYGNQISLGKRLTLLASRLSEPICRLLFGASGKVPRSWIDTRNYYTHWDVELRSRILDDRGLIRANVRMQHFLRVLYLDAVGVPQAAILAALQGLSGPAQYLCQVNDQERAEQDPAYTSPAYATLSTQRPSDGGEAPPGG